MSRVKEGPSFFRRFLKRFGQSDEVFSSQKEQSLPVPAFGF